MNFEQANEARFLLDKQRNLEGYINDLSKMSQPKIELREDLSPTIPHVCLGYGIQDKPLAREILIMTLAFFKKELESVNQKIEKL